MQELGPPCVSQEVVKIFEEHHYCILGACTSTRHILKRHIGSNTEENVILGHIKPSGPWIKFAIRWPPDLQQPHPPLVSHDWHSQHSLPSPQKVHRTPNTWLCHFILAHLPPNGHPFNTSVPKLPHKPPLTPLKFCLWASKVLLLYSHRDSGQGLGPWGILTNNVPSDFCPPPTFNHMIRSRVLEYILHNKVKRRGVTP